MFEYYLEILEETLKCLQSLATLGQLGNCNVEQVNAWTPLCVPWIVNVNYMIDTQHVNTRLTTGNEVD